MNEFYRHVLRMFASPRGNGWAAAVIVLDRPRYMQTLGWPVWSGLT